MAHRFPYNFDKLDGDDLAELFGPALAPEPAPVPRRQRKRSLTKVCEAARKVGAKRVVVDGIAIELSPAASVAESVSLTDSTANEWDAVLPEGDHGAR